MTNLFWSLCLYISLYLYLASFLSLCRHHMDWVYVPVPSSPPILIILALSGLICFHNIHSGPLSLFAMMNAIKFLEDEHLGQ